MAERTKRADPPVVPLSAVSEGVVVQMVRAECGRGLCARLTSMGLLPGARFRVLKAAPPGPLVVVLGNARLALGRGIAHRIMVTTLSPA